MDLTAREMHALFDITKERDTDGDNGVFSHHTGGERGASGSGIISESSSGLSIARSQEGHGGELEATSRRERVLDPHRGLLLFLRNCGLRRSELSTVLLQIFYLKNCFLSVDVGQLTGKWVGWGGWETVISCFLTAECTRLSQVSKP